MEKLIKKFWEDTKNLSQIATELFDNLQHIEDVPEPDAGTLEILANCDAIEEAIENQNQIEAENQSQIEEISTDDLVAECLRGFAERRRIYNEIRSQLNICKEELNEIASQIKNENQSQLELELAEALADIDAMAQPTEYEVGINNIQEYLATDNGSQIEYDDDMDEFDRRNIERYLAARAAL